MPYYAIYRGLITQKPLGFITEAINDDDDVPKEWPTEAAAKYDTKDHALHNFIEIIEL